MIHMNHDWLKLESILQFFLVKTELVEIEICIVIEERLEQNTKEGVQFSVRIGLSRTEQNHSNDRINFGSNFRADNHRLTTNLSSFIETLNIFIYFMGRHSTLLRPI